MKPLIKLKTTTVLFIPLALACFALLPSAQAFTTDPDETFPNFNTAAGLEALLFTTGASNTAYGARALRANTTGSSNLGLGGFALINNLDGVSNTAVGNNAMFSNQHGDNNMALGQGALATNVSGDNNVAMGARALNQNTASGNVGVGFQALASSTLPGVNTFGGNVAIGFQALTNTTGSSSTGDSNTAVGDRAMLNNISGFENTAIGKLAGSNLTGNGNVCLGQGVVGVAGESAKTRIKNVSNTAQANSIFVTIGPGGLLGFQVSSRRFKDDIKPMDKASETLFALKPVSFHYKQEADPARSLDFGLIAEDVADVNPDLVARDEHGKIVTVRYQAVYAMMLNEFLKEHKKVEAQQASIAELKSTVALQQKEMHVLTAQLKEQAAQIQKVSAQVEVNKPGPRTVSNK